MRIRVRRSCASFQLRAGKRKSKIQQSRLQNFRDPTFFLRHVNKSLTQSPGARQRGPGLGDLLLNARFPAGKCRIGAQELLLIVNSLLYVIILHPHEQNEIFLCIRQ